MTDNWLQQLKRDKARRRARDRLTLRIQAHTAVRDSCRTELAGLTGLSPGDEQLAKRLTKEIDKREHAIRCLRAELNALGMPA